MKICYIHQESLHIYFSYYGIGKKDFNCYRIVIFSSFRSWLNVLSKYLNHVWLFFEFQNQSDKKQNISYFNLCIF